MDEALLEELLTKMDEVTRLLGDLLERNLVGTQDERRTLIMDMTTQIGKIKYALVQESRRRRGL